MIVRTATTEQSARALVIVDPQRDFAELGSLAVVGGNKTAENIANYAYGHADVYRLIVVTRDWHPALLVSHFSNTPDYIDSWPAHCVQGTFGAEFITPIANLLTSGKIDVVVSKGQHSAAYSGFEGSDDSGNSLDQILSGISQVDICGIATSHCVRATAIDAYNNGYSVTVFTDLSVGVTDELHTKTLSELHNMGIKLATSV
jgi:nicotinamidase/pyrazinamidase